MESYYTSLIIFSILAYVIITDNSVAKFFSYAFDLLKNRIVREIWWIKNNPQNPIVKYLMWRRSMKLAKEIQKEFSIKKSEEKQNE